jgi:hypothetical protein
MDIDKTRLLPNYMNMHSQILLEDGGSNQLDENFAQYQ